MPYSWQRFAGWWMALCLVTTTATSAPAGTVLAPWGVVSGMRVGDEWVEFEAGVRVIRPDRAGFSSAVKYLQRPRYTSEGNRRGVVSRIGEVDFGVVVEDVGPGRALWEWKLKAPSGQGAGEVVICLDVPAWEFGGGAVEVPESGPEGRGILSSRPSGDSGDYLRVIGSKVRIQGRRQKLELSWAEPREIRVRREGADHPTSLNDPKVDQVFTAWRGDESVGYQVYVALAKPGTVAGDGTVSMRFELEAIAVSDRDPVRMSVDTSRPGRPFDGIGGNFRLQFPATDPAVIAYNLEHLPVAWGRIEMPWAAWDPEEGRSPMETARGGTLAAPVRESMEMARTLGRKGMPVIVSAWNPPAWARAEGPQPAGLRGTALSRAKQPRIRSSLADFLVFLAERYGVEARLFSFNEPETGVEVRQTAEEHAEFTKEMGRELARRGLATRMLLGDTAHGTPKALTFLGPSLADAEVRSRVGAIGFHTWRGCTREALPGWLAAARQLDVPLLVTEAGPDAHLHEYPGVRLEPWFQLQSIELYLRTCAFGQPATIMEWQLTTDYSVLSGGGVYGEPGPLRPTWRFWNLAQLGRTPAGARAVPVTCENRLITAAGFLGPVDGAAAIHVVNRGGERPAVIEGLPRSSGALRMWVTDATRGMADVGRVRPKEGLAEFVLPAASYVTLLTEESR